jgi:hypothetical protein
LISLTADPSGTGDLTVDPDARQYSGGQYWDSGVQIDNPPIDLSSIPGDHHVRFTILSNGLMTVDVGSDVPPSTPFFFASVLDPLYSLSAKLSPAQMAMLKAGTLYPCAEVLNYYSDGPGVLSWSYETLTGTQGPGGKIGVTRITGGSVRNLTPRVSGGQLRAQ